MVLATTAREMALERPVRVMAVARAQHVAWVVVVRCQRAGLIGDAASLRAA